MGRNKELNKLRRRNQSRENGRKSSASRSSGVAHSNGDGAGEQSGRQRGPWGKLWTFLSAYPALIITVVILVLRCLPWCMRWMRLQSGLLGPIMDVHAEKQVLILGAVGSGTANTSRALQRLGLEIGHEVSDSAWEQCRDGTISWAHAIRFLRGKPNLTMLCTGSRHNAYHSSMIRPSRTCSRWFRRWDKCWEDECRGVTAEEFGCALEKEAFGERGGVGDEFNGSSGDGKNGGGRDGGGEKRCATPFRKTLLQVRHPLEFVAFLAQKSSATTERVGMDCSRARQQLAAITSLFPNKVVREHIGSTRARPPPPPTTTTTQDCVPNNAGTGQEQDGNSRTTTTTNNNNNNNHNNSRSNDRGNINSSGTRKDTHSTFSGDDSWRGDYGDDYDPFSVFDWTLVTSSCVETWSWYWVIYNMAMLPFVDGWYRVEHTPPSEVATLAGFSGAKIEQAGQDADDTVLAMMNAMHPSQEVEDTGLVESESGGDEDAQLSSSDSPYADFEVTWEDIASYPNGLLREMSDLAVRLGYDGAPGMAPDPNESASDSCSDTAEAAIENEEEAEGAGGDGGGQRKKGFFRRLFGFLGKKRNKSKRKQNQ